MQTLFLCGNIRACPQASQGVRPSLLLLARTSLRGIRSVLHAMLLRPANVTIQPYVTGPAILPFINTLASHVIFVS